MIIYAYVIILFASNTAFFARAILDFLLAPVFLCKTPFETALSTAFVASLINVSSSVTLSAVALGNNSSANVFTFLMRVAISDFFALLYMRCFVLKIVRATLFCLQRIWNPVCAPGIDRVRLVVDANLHEPVFIYVQSLLKEYVSKQS
jgi:hypothetical protein